MLEKRDSRVSNFPKPQNIVKTGSGTLNLFDGIIAENKDKETFCDPLGYGVMEYVNIEFWVAKQPDFDSVVLPFKNPTTSTVTIHQFGISALLTEKYMI